MATTWQPRPFPTPPSPAHAEDPRFERLFSRALERHGIPAGRSTSVRGLVTGSLSQQDVWCCNSGCQPCARDYHAAAHAVLKGLAAPPDAAPLLPGLPTFGVRRTLGGLLGRR